MSYIIGHPIKNPADFYGRYNQVVRFYEIIGGTQAQSVSVLGMRRAGKTSFLQYVAHQDVIARYLPDPAQYTMVYIDVSSCKNPSHFYDRLLLRLKTKLGDTEAVNLWKESPPGTATMYDVEAYLCQFPNRRIVLLLDEFDQLRTDSFDQDFLTELRAMTSVLDYDLACVTASYWDLYYLGNKVGLPPTSPFYNIFYPSAIFLSGLEEKEVDTLIRSPIKGSGVQFTKSDVAQIKDLAGNLPFFIQATSAQWLRRKRAGQEIKPTRILRQLAADLSPYFDQWWRQFDTVQQELLHSLAQTRLMEQLPYGSIELSEAIRHLQNYGILCEDEGKLVINGTIFKSWIRQYAQVKAQNMHTNGKSEEFPASGTLRQILLQHFNTEELRNLCFDMDLDFEELPGNEKGSKARAIIEYWRNRKELEKLVEAIRRERGPII